MKKAKFIPYTETTLVDNHNGITSILREHYRTKTIHSRLTNKIAFLDWQFEFLSPFDTFSPDFWKSNNSELSRLLSGELDKPLDSHYGNYALGFIFNLLVKFPEKSLLLENIDRWANYYRKHVTDKVSTMSAKDLHTDVFVQRLGIRSKSHQTQQYFHHSLQEIESSNIPEYYYFRYEVSKDCITFYTNAIYSNLPTYKLFFTK